ncbi:MAG: UMP kinase [Anaerolineaceae bacterium 4572_78]|nr:MAG: UMP kinase [Anaerolineaceae bacterium 4572_78]
MKYNRILLKLGGEALGIHNERGIDPNEANVLAQKIKLIKDLDIQIGVVIGAGNLWRGMKDGAARGMDRTTADHIGMLATVMNALALADALKHYGIETRVQTAIEMRAVAEPYIRGRAIRHMQKGRVVILGAGTGNPFFTTDTAAALRAAEIDAEVLIKATKVDGVYDCDPVENPNAKRIERLTYIEALNLGVKVMDNTALTLCMDNQMPIIVLNLWHENSVGHAVMGKKVGTIICP